MEDDIVSVDTKKKCVICNKEMALAGFGIVLGLVFIMMSIDTIRRMRMTTTVVEETSA